jgi:predicted site-specific integrase-resolvase
MCYDKRLAFIKTLGGHFRLPESELMRLVGRKPAPPNSGAMIYARVSSAENSSNLDTQAKRLTEYCIAKGVPIREVIKETASGINDKRPKLLKMLEKIRLLRPALLVVEHKDRLARIGASYIEAAIRPFGCAIEVVNPAETEKDDLMTDLVSIITSFCARYYGQRRARRKTDRIIAELKSKNGDSREKGA